MLSCGRVSVATPAAVARFTPDGNVVARGSAAVVNPASSRHGFGIVVRGQSHRRSGRAHWGPTHPLTISRSACRARLMANSRRLELPGVRISGGPMVLPPGERKSAAVEQVERRLFILPSGRPVTMIGLPGLVKEGNFFRLSNERQDIDFGAVLMELSKLEDALQRRDVGAVQTHLGLFGRSVAVALFIAGLDDQRLHEATRRLFSEDVSSVPLYEDATIFLNGLRHGIERYGRLRDDRNALILDELPELDPGDLVELPSSGAREYDFGTSDPSFNPISRDEEPKRTGARDFELDPQAGASLPGYDEQSVAEARRRFFDIVGRNVALDGADLKAPRLGNPNEPNVVNDLDNLGRHFGWNEPDIKFELDTSGEWWKGYEAFAPVRNEYDWSHYPDEPIELNDWRLLRRKRPSTGRRVVLTNPRR